MLLPGLTEVFGYDFMQRALVAGLSVAVVASLLGVFNILRGMALVSDGLAHVSLAGVALGLAFGLYPVWMGLLAAICGGLSVQILRERQLAKSDTAIGIIFSAGLAVGIALISRGGRLNVNAGNYLFGSILAVTRTDLVTVAVAGAVVLAALLLFYKEMLYLAFNEQAARVSGLPVNTLNTGFMILTATTVVLVVRVVGVLLASALMIVPAAASLQVARSFRGALLLSVALGMVCVVLGLYASFVVDIASGAAIALASTLVFVVMVAVSRIRRTLAG
jgi:zinc transport system permease protein